MHRSASKRGEPENRRLVRAAVYCRVSTDESLHLEFNSLDAQREACEAYIKSQQHEGWTLSPGRFEDGGFSGGTLERPALKQLLEEIAAHNVDVIVVYKIDRLTRSLTDFARIVDVLDRSSASFVSVTQAFSTVTSMGRLTLNVLLSFAQFEREVGAERVRDKIAASKKKGMWMGGVCALGYDVSNRKLVINEPEAETVRTIFELYLKFGSVLVLETELVRRGIVSKLRTSRDGMTSGGRTFTRGALYALLQNRLYIGRICHRGTAYPGQHAGIVDEATFAEAQALLESNCGERRVRSSTADIALLTGLVWDEAGQRMSPTHTKKGVARYRYYSTKPDHGSASTPTRVAAAELEKIVTARIMSLLDDRRALHDAVEPWSPDAVMLEAVLFAAKTQKQILASDHRGQARELLRKLIRRIDVLSEQVGISVRPAAFLELAALSLPEGSTPRDLELRLPVRMFRRAREVRLAIEPGAGEGDAVKDPALIKLLIKAWAARQALINGGGLSLKQVARESHQEPGYFAVLVKLGYLAPDLTQAILCGQQHQTLTRQQLARKRDLPVLWDEQRELLSRPTPG